MGIHGCGVRAYSSCLMHVIVARMRLPFFQYIFKFFTFFSNVQICCHIFALFLLFFWKITHIPLLSRISPGCTSSAWTNFLYNIEIAPVSKVSLTFSSQDHTPLQLVPMCQWLILNCNQTLQANFLAFYNNLVSQFRDLLRPWNFLKYVYLTNEVYWWNHSHMTYLKVFLWSVNYTPVMLNSQWHYWSSSLHKECSWYKIPSHFISRSWDTSVWWRSQRGGGYIPPTSYLPSYYPPHPLYPHYSSKIVSVQKLFA